MIPRQLTAEEILASIKTEADAHEAIAELEQDIDDITTQVHNQRILFDQGLMDEDQFDSWLLRAVGARTFKERALMRVQRWIKHQEHNRQMQEDAAARRAMKEAVKVNKTDEDIDLARDFKRATLEATKQKNELRTLQLTRERKSVEMIDQIVATNDPVLLKAACDLLLSLAQLNRVTYTPDEEATIQALKTVCSAMWHDGSLK